MGPKSSIRTFSDLVAALEVFIVKNVTKGTQHDAVNVFLNVGLQKTRTTMLNLKSVRDVSDN